MRKFPLPLLLCLLLLVGVVSADTLITNSTHDGFMQEGTDSIWTPTMRDGVGDYVSNNPADYCDSGYLQATTTSNVWDYNRRCGVIFNGSIIADDATITGATVSSRGVTKDSGWGTNINASIIRFTPASYTTAAATDYDNTDWVRYAADIPYASYTDAGWNNWTGNAALIANVSKTGNFGIMFTHSFDVDNVSVAWGSNKGGAFNQRSAASTGGIYAPYLTITYTPAAPADTTPPASITNITNATTCSSIAWNWTNPGDSDFNHTYTFRNNVHWGNLTNFTIGVNWTGLAATTMYNISTKTVDTTGNMNATWVNASATTSACPTPTTTVPPTTTLPTVTPTLGPSSDRDRWCGSPLIFFQHEGVPEPAGFEGLDIYPAASPEDDENVTVKDSTGEKLVDSYISLTNFPNIVMIRSGLWRFRTFHYVSTASGDTVFNFSVSIWNTTGWRYLFHVNTDPVNSLFPIEVLTSYALMTNTTILESDRIVVNVSAKTDHSANVEAHFVYEGNTNTSHVQVSYLDCPERCPHACFPTTAATPWQPYIAPSTDIKVDWIVVLSQWWWVPVLLTALWVATLWRRI